MMTKIFDLKKRQKPHWQRCKDNGDGTNSASLLDSSVSPLKCTSLSSSWPISSDEEQTDQSQWSLKRIAKPYKSQSADTGEHGRTLFVTLSLTLTVLEVQQCLFLATFIQKA